MCVHVLFPGTAECYYSRDPLVRIIDPYPKSTTDAYWYNSVEPRGKEFWQKVVWTSVERKITELLLNAREGVLHIDHQLKRAGHRYKRIIFLQPDMVFDSRGNAYMVEVNTQGYMIGNLHKQFFELYKQQKAVFKLLGAHGYPEKGHYMDELRERARLLPRPRLRRADAARDSRDGPRGHARVVRMVPHLPAAGRAPPARRLLPIDAAVRESADAARPPDAEVGGAGMGARAHAR